MKRSTTYDNFVAVDEDLISTKEQMIRFQHVCGGNYEIMTLTKALEIVSADSPKYIDCNTSISSGISILMIIYVICYII